ncbi:RHS repeat domain-containing protein, partial [Pseudomonas sp. CDFA 610]|uniref:RHS repeat domain-containing protein n=1 Tax=Pseudomonas sp. CDFA 610 TaxID=2829825 RepID=UPI001E64199F
TFTYDCENRLVKAETLVNSQLHSTGTYQYDSLGRRVAKQSEVNGQTQHKRFLWQGLRMLREEQPGQSSLYIYEPGSYAPLARVDQREGEPENTLYYFHTDQIGTPLEMTDTDGQIVWQATYKAWGSIEALTVNEVEQNLRFQGQYFDEETGLHYNTFRYYDPEVGRFVTQDPIGFLGGLNLYSYVPAPTLWIDPLGWLPWEKGGFDSWFNNASVADVLKNKTAVGDALRRPGGKHEMFPVSIAAKAKELGFSAQELRELTVPTKDVTFVGVTDALGNPVPDGSHHNSSAGRNFHNKLIRDLAKTQTKAQALSVIDAHHRAHMKLGSC